MAERKTDDDTLLNKQINFLVMRKMWQKIRGRAKNGTGAEETIYTAFQMSRERYTRAIDGGNIRFSSKELEYLVNMTGLRREIFEGRDCFQFESISKDDWKNLFILRGGNIRQFKKREKALFDKIKDSDIDLVKNADYYRFLVYLNNGAVEIDFSLEEKVRDYTEWLSKAGMEKLEKCHVEVLKEYYKQLRRQTDMVGTILHYNELKQLEKK